jgi:hypothetical protein
MERERSSVFADRDRTGPEAYDQTFLLLEEFFLNNGHELQEVKGLARKIKITFEKISPLIQQTTRTECPHCAEVCCIGKHGFYNYEDLVYLCALGLKPPSIGPARNAFDPCRFLTENGCSMERSVRPSGCNWYFCGPLLEVIEKRPDYHEFDDSLRDLAELWLEMIDKFSKISPLRPT